MPIEKYGILFACAQKNAGPAGVTIVIIRDDLVARSPADLPSMVNYKVLAEGKSLLNTPPTFAIYMVKLVTDWLINEIGGLEKMAELNRRKAKLLYDVIDGSGGFYQGHAEPDSRSMMNVPFRLANTAHDEPFLKQAAERGLVELKGHRSRRRLPGVDLQRHAHRRRATAGRLHARVLPEEQINCSCRVIASYASVNREDGDYVMQGPGIIGGVVVFLLWLLMMGGMIGGWIILLVAVWRGMRAIVGGAKSAKDSRQG